VAIGTPAELKQRVAGDVILLETRDPEALQRQVRERFGNGAAAPSDKQARLLAVSVVDGSVVIERRDGHVLIPQLVEAFPGAIQSVRLGKPTLEDVFAHETGHRFQSAEATPS
jgi:ABC-2 type transport system ATP-binding protein